MDSVSNNTPNLLINKYIDEILDLIDGNLVIQINAATGSGKSIGIPKAISEQGKRVFVSVPTRVSAISLSSYLQSLNTDVSVGYAADGTCSYDKYTRVVYATSGHMRRKMLNCFSKGSIKNRGLNFTDVLVLDETHSGSLDNSVILSLWMYAYKHKMHVPTLVLLSATPSKLHIKPEPVIYTVPVPTPFHVETVYDAPDDNFDIYTHAKDIVLSNHNGGIQGDFLIFVPGSKEAEDLVTQLKSEISEEDAVILPAYSALNSNELKLIYSAVGNKRKIIVATNIAESSITIEGLVMVIDTMYCREATVSPSGAIRLETCKITKSSAQQRLGRVGRTSRGICCRLISEKDYDELDDHRKPEIERMPIHNTVMEFLKAGIDPVDAIVGIHPDRVSESIQLLTRLNMLDNDSGKIIVTPCGDFAPTVPLGVRNACFLWRWIQQGLPLYPGIVVASLIDSHSTGYFYVPRKRQNMSQIEYNSFCDAYITKTFKHWVGVTPLHTYLNMWKAFTTSFARFHYRLIDNPSSVNFNKWTGKNSVNQRQLCDLVSIISQTYRIVSSNNKRNHVSIIDTDMIMTNSIPIFQDIYQDNAITPNYRGDLCHPISGVKHVFDTRRIISDIERNNKDRIIPLAVHEILTSIGRPLVLIDVCIPFPQPNI